MTNPSLMVVVQRYGDIAGGGVTYGDADGFGDALDRAIAARAELGAAGRAWVERESSWDAFDARLAQLVALTAA